MAEQNSATKLKKARGARKTAKVELRIAREKLRRIEKALTTLEAEKRLVQKQRQENEATLQHLDEQLRERRREEDAIAEQVQRQNELIDAIQGAEGRKDERAQVESRLAALDAHLDEIREGIAGLETQERQARGRQTKIGVRLSELDDKIKEKSEEKESAEKEVKSKEESLSEKRDAVAKAFEAVNIEMVADPFNHLIGDPIKHMRDWIFKLRDILQFFGVASAVYVYTLLSGFVYERQFYRSNNLDISHYTTLSDFLLIPPVLWGIGFVGMTGFLVMLIFLTAKAPGWVVNPLSHIVGHPMLRGLLIVTLLVGGPFLAGCWKYNPSGKERVDVKKGDTVTVLTNPPLRNAKKLLLVGSNSNYMFFKNTMGNDSAGVKAIPLTRIVCVGQDGCEAKATEPAGYSDYIAERLLPQFISEQMQCKGNTSLIISDFIRFVNDQPNPRCPECPSVADPSADSTDDNTRYEAMKALYQEKIGSKVQDIVKEFMDKSATRWTVFGFASPDGEEVENDSLSRVRARVVIDEMCRLQENGTLDPAIDCGKKEERYADTQVRYFGEWHPINGISNSRSAVIAACVGTTNETSPKTPRANPSK